MQLRQRKSRTGRLPISAGDVAEGFQEKSQLCLLRDQILCDIVILVQGLCVYVCVRVCGHVFLSFYSHKDRNI